MEDPAWSHSAHCGSFAYVRNRAQAVLSIYSPVRTTFTLIMFPTAGVVADVIGRKPVLVAAACGPLIAASIFWLDTYFELRTNMLLYCCSAVLALGTESPFQAGLQQATVDGACGMRGGRSRTGHVAAAARQEGLSIQ